MLLEQFRRDLVLKNRAKNTIRGINLALGTAEATLKKPLETLTIEDLKRYFEGLKEKKLNPNTIGLFQQRFIQFYEWCFNETDNEKYSTLSRKIKRIKIDRVKSDIIPSEILLPEDIKKLINVATIERDRCILAVLYESGMRIGELLTLKTDMIEMKELNQEVQIHIPNIEGCKTGSRSVTCLEIYGYVQDWLKCNPSKQFMPLSRVGVSKALNRLFK
ncbi:MAG: tyrosine-type recombinase/integrase, partial [Candidatus Methanoperedens sp.]|nr:tyrosine-type recombinase/integrase [Candidatus Methanoperedens sp.]